MSLEIYMYIFCIIIWFINLILTFFCLMNDIVMMLFMNALNKLVSFSEFLEISKIENDKFNVRIYISVYEILDSNDSYSKYKISLR